MLSSLRIRLPLLFLAGILLAGVVTTVIGVQLFGDFARKQSVSALSREAAGIAALYSSAIAADFAAKEGDSRRAPKFARAELERATGDLIYFDGPVSPFPGEDPGLPRLNLKRIDWTAGRTLTFQFTPPGRTGEYYAVAHPVMVGKTPIGAIIVAKRKTEITALVDNLGRRLAIAGLVGLLIAGGIAVYASRRLVRPLFHLSKLADEVAIGNYDVEVPPHAAGEIGHLAERLDEMAGKLKEGEARERNFLMSVSHELRTPLTAIQGHVALLADGLVDDPELRARSLETVADEARRLGRLVGDILDLARLDAHRFTVRTEEVGMERLVEQAYQTFREEARSRGMRYDLDVDASPVIVSDGDRLLQIVDNLLANAFRATPDGGRIGLSLAQQNGSIHVAVEDNGPGIAPEDQERLFRPFVSGQGGTGLGLTIARELSHALGGRIELDSRVGRGSRFELVLPAVS